MRLTKKLALGLLVTLAINLPLRADSPTEIVCLASFVSNNSKIPNFSLSENHRYFETGKAAILGSDPQGGNLTQYALSEDAIEYLTQPIVSLTEIASDGASLFRPHEELSRFGSGSSLTLRFLDNELKKAFPEAFGELVFSCYPSQNN